MLGDVVEAKMRKKTQESSHTQYISLPQVKDSASEVNKVPVICREKLGDSEA